MKKSLVAILALSSIVFAADADVEKFVKDISANNGNIPVKIVSTKTIDNGIKEVILDIEGVKRAFFLKGEYLFPDIIDMKNHRSLAKDANDILAMSSISAVYKKENKNNIITIGNNPANPTQVILSDPECPYCRAELKKMENEKDKFNYKVILTPIHGRNSLAKGFLIYKEIKNAKTDSEKFAILNKYYSNDAKISSNVSDQDIAKIEKIGEKYFKAGVTGVPFIKNEKDLLK